MPWLHQPPGLSLLHQALPTPQARAGTHLLSGQGALLSRFGTFPCFSLQITQLKIASNPFAKGFRDCDPEDW